MRTAPRWEPTNVPRSSSASEKRISSPRRRRSTKRFARFSTAAFGNRLVQPVAALGGGGGRKGQHERRAGQECESSCGSRASQITILGKWPAEWESDRSRSGQG